MSPLNRHPVPALLFIALLISVQLFAFKTQFVRGFYPLRHEPTRVPYSWDMFANRVERCTMEWSPPLQTLYGPLSSMRQLGTKIEWDVIFDYVGQYQSVGRWLCLSVGQQVRVRLHCFLQNGTEFDDAISC